MTKEQKTIGTLEARIAKLKEKEEKNKELNKVLDDIGSNEYTTTIEEIHGALAEIGYHICRKPSGKKVEK